jgi:hypothetical protein
MNRFDKKSGSVSKRGADHTCEAFSIYRVEDFMMNQPITHSKPHSKLGVASFAIGVGTFSVAVLWYILITIISSSVGSQVRGNLFIFYMLFLIFVAPVAHLVGAILGIVSLFTKNCRKVFPVLGLLVNLPFLVFWVLAYSLLFHLYRQGWIG